MSLNILFVSHSSELNGAERMLFHLIKGIDRSKFNPFLVIPNSGPLEEKMMECQCPTVIIPMKWRLSEKSKIWKQFLSPVLNRKSIAKISDLIGEWKIDLVFSNSAVLFCGALAAERNNLPHVWSIHENLKGSSASLHYLWGWKKLVQKISKKSCCVVVNSIKSQQAFKNFSNVTVVYNGILFNHKKQRNRNEIRTSLNLNKNDIVLSVIGKIYSGKAQKETIQAVSQLLFEFPSIKLFVIGEVKDKRYFSALKKIVRKFNLEHFVSFVGKVDHPFNYLIASDLHVIASKVESFGRTAVEAMAVRTPVLAFDKGGLSEIISPNQNGFLMKANDPETIKNEIKAILLNRSENTRIIENGYNTYKKRFSLENHINRIETILLTCEKEEKNHA